MKRFLSLALVLIMVLSVMPMASAACAEGAHTGLTETPATCTTAGSRTGTCTTCNTDVNETIPALDHKSVGDNWTPVEGKEATCVTGGLEMGYCPDCKAAVTRETDPTNEHDFDESVTANVTTYAATCKEDAKKVIKCKNCAQTSIVKTANTATGAHNYGDDGKCTNTLQDGTTKCGVERNTTLTAANLTLTVNESKTIVINEELAEDATVTFTSGNTAIATVNATSGSVTGVAKGKATITFVASTGESGSCEVTVSNSGVISCDNVETYGSSATLTPTLKVNGETVSAKFKFSSNADAAADGKSATVSSSKSEVIKVTITVEAYTGGSAEDVANIESKDVYVSFYDFVDAEVTVKKDVESFMFTDTNVFSAVSIEDSIVLNPAAYSMTRLWSGTDYYKIILEQEDPTTDVGVITYTSLSTYKFKPNTANPYSLSNIEFLKFTCQNEGTFKLLYTLKDKDTGLICQTGTIKINVGDVEGDIVYKTGFKKDVVLDESDFASYWAVSKMKGNLDYVVFENQPTLGMMKTDGTTDAKTVTSTMKFFNKYVSTDKGYDLDAAVYRPYSKAISAYTDTVSFTCYSEDGKETLSGVVEFKVGLENPFKDVKESDYFYDAVMWAVEEEITTGTSATTFSPDQVCTRGQVVTFLWRAAGEPAPKTTVNPFTDVKKDDFYYKAVLWAYEKGITTGITATTFGPNQAITRSQAVTFLYRYNNEPAVTGTNSFVDVSSTAYYDDAVTWAVKNGITNGMSATKFAPNDGCTRAQIVTFLYRDAE